MHDVHLPVHKPCILLAWVEDGSHSGNTLKRSDIGCTSNVGTSLSMASSSSDIWGISGSFHHYSVMLYTAMLHDLPGYTTHTDMSQDGYHCNLCRALWSDPLCLMSETVGHQIPSFIPLYTILLHVPANDRYSMAHSHLLGAVRNLTCGVVCHPGVVLSLE